MPSTFCGSCHMAASIIRTLPSCSPLLFRGNKPLITTLQKVTIVSMKDVSRQGRLAIVAKASGENSDSSTSLNVLESLQNVWENSEDRLAVVGLGFAAIVALWASTNLIGIIDKLPILPGTLEFIGIIFSSWFVYRYLLFKPEREELIQIINKSVSDVLGQ